MSNQLQRSAYERAIAAVDERLKDLSQGTCVEVRIYGDEQVVESVLSYFRGKGIDIEYLYPETSELKLLLVTAY